MARRLSDRAGQPAVARGGGAAGRAAEQQAGGCLAGGSLAYSRPAGRHWQTFGKRAFAVVVQIPKFRRGGWLLAMALTAGLAGCSSEWQHNRELAERQNTTPPISYRSDITAFMRTYLNDPTRI